MQFPSLEKINEHNDASNEFDLALLYAIEMVIHTKNIHVITTSKNSSLGRRGRTTGGKQFRSPVVTIFTPKSKVHCTTICKLSVPHVKLDAVAWVIRSGPQMFCGIPDHSISERRILCLSYHLGSRQEPLLHGRLTNNSNKDDLELKLVALNGHLVPRKCNGRDPELTQTCNAK